MPFDAEQYLKYFGFQKITRRHDNMMASCPDFKDVHPRGDKRPSFGIHIRSGLSNCFSCDTRLNLEQLTSKLLSRLEEKMITEYDAWKWLEEKGWLPEEPSARDLLDRLENNQQQEGLNILDEGILEQFHNGVHPSIIYDRGISVEAAKEWGLRYDKMMKRTIIPVRNFMGLLVGCLTRSASNETFIRHTVGVPTLTGELIYEFKKSLVLFGEHKVGNKEVLLLVESPLDVIYAWSHGLQNQMDILASMGTKLSAVQQERLMKYKEVIIAFDNDASGEEGTKALIKKLMGKIKLYTFDHFGAKDLGEVEPDDLNLILEYRKPVINEKLSKIKLKS